MVTQRWSTVHELRLKLSDRAAQVNGPKCWSLRSTVLWYPTVCYGMLWSYPLSGCVHLSGDDRGLDQCPWVSRPFQFIVCIWHSAGGNAWRWKFRSRPIDNRRRLTSHDQRALNVGAADSTQSIWFRRTIGMGWQLVRKQFGSKSSWFATYSTDRFQTGACYAKIH